MLALLIFLLCFTSFAIVLSLGGGPGAATLEVAIYERGSLRRRFRARRPACAPAGGDLPGDRAADPLVHAPPGRDSLIGCDPVAPGRGRAAAMKVLDIAVLSAGSAPRPAAARFDLASGIAAIASLARPDVLEATITSFVIAIPAAAIALLLALGIASTARRLRSARRPRSAAALSLPGRTDPRRAAGRRFRRPLRRAAAGRRPVRDWPFR